MRIYKSNTQLIIATENNIQKYSIPLVESAMTLYTDDVAITVGIDGRKLERVRYVNVMNASGVKVGDKDAVIAYLSGFVSLDVTTLAEGTEVSISDGSEVATYELNEASNDAFGRKRVSNTGQRFDVEFIYDLQPTIFDTEEVGGGSVSHNADSRDVTLAVGDAADGSIGRLVQHWHNPYTAGNSQLIDITGTMNVNDLVGTAEIFVKNGIDSSETVYTQDTWNVNTASDVDWGTSQILQIDFQSLKVGVQRVLLVREGAPVVVHKIFNDNKTKGGYWQYPSLPLQWNCYNTATESISEMGYFDETNGIGLRFRTPINASFQSRAICATVKSEGGDGLYDIEGFNKAVDTGVIEKTVSGTPVPIISIRPAQLFNVLDNRGLYVPTGYEMFTDQPTRYRVLLNPTLTGATFNNVDISKSGMQYDISATAVSGGQVIDSGYIAAGRNIVGSAKSSLGKTLLSLGYRSSGSDILTIEATATTGTSAEVLGSIKWKEIR